MRMFRPMIWRSIGIGALIMVVGLATPTAGASIPSRQSSQTLRAGHSTYAQAKPTKAAIEKTCQQVADVLSDGPDPEADPVGYALAQILPLRQIKTSDTPLHKAIDALANAYETVYKTNDKKGTETAVNEAGKNVDKICPGAF